MADNSLALAAAAGIGLVLYSQRQKQLAAAKLAATQTGVRYSTPTAIAETLARLVVGMTKGTTPKPPAAGVFTTQIVAPSSPGGSAPAGAAGWQNLVELPSSLGGVFSDWSVPSASIGKDASVSRFGQSIDQIAAAPVYDPSTDFVQNPLSFNWSGW